MAPTALDGDAIFKLSKCKTLQQIKDFNNRKVNVVGLIKDFRMPMATSGKDWKCEMQIVDHSIEGQSREVSFFGPQGSLPESVENNTVAIIQQIKVQTRGDVVSLLTNKYSTRILLMPLSKLKQKTTVSSTEWKIYTGSEIKDKRTPPTQPEIEYARWMASRFDEGTMPSAVEFDTRVIRSGNYNDKFKLLQEVVEERWYDILGQVVKIYEPGPGRISVYFTDYTANSKFYRYLWPGMPEERDEETSGYVRGPTEDEKGWPGPYGKMSIQLTLFDEHADRMRVNFKINDWLYFSNVHIRLDQNGGLLEGKVRGEANGFGGKMRAADKGDPRYKDAIIRKLDYQKKFVKQKKQALEASVSNKRKGDHNEPAKENSREKRRRLRAGIDKRVTESVAKVRSDLNENGKSITGLMAKLANIVNVKCNQQDQPVTTIKTILKYELLKKESGAEIHSPFTICKYRANVRVTDYWPPRLEDFAVGRRSNEMDILSDYSGGEDTDPEETNRNGSKGKGSLKDTWEWRFELQVEDAESEGAGGKERVWLTVDNQAAQGLLALEEDATDLRSNPELLAKLKEQLCKLWGDLEEKESLQLALQKSNNKSTSTTDTPSSTFSSMQSTPPTVPKSGAQPNIDSDVEDGNTHGLTAKKLVLEDRVNKPKNKAFSCCISQYGIEVPEEDLDKASAGYGKRWQRKFGLFGTTIK